jgi:Ca2+-binding EF-hand superfamily protein
MSNLRKKLVMQAFTKIDSDKSGFVDINDIKGVYNASRHPDVIQGKKTEDDVLMEFLETFEVHHSARESKAPDHVVTKDEFQEYYENISASCDNDQYFELMMTNAWKLNEEPKPKASWSNQSSPDKSAKQAPETGDPVERLRAKLCARGAKGFIGMQRQFKIMDDNNSKTIDMSEFKKACSDFRINLSPKEITQVFQAFDRDGSGEIDYDEFVRGVRGPMNQFRKKIAMAAFKKIDRDGNGVLELNDIKDTYNARMHPDVKAGKKTEDEVLGEFLETFELHHAMNGGRRDQKVDPEEFVEYYNNVSASIDRDDYFELMMINAWKLMGEAPKKPAWTNVQK